MTVNMWHNPIMNDLATQACCPILPVASANARRADLGDYAHLMKALAEPMRLNILAIMASQQGEAVCACSFPEALGISQPTASHHLKRLTDAGILTREQRGKWAWFTLVPDQLLAVQRFLGGLTDGL